jgi:Zn-dependent peptidase ImmA (M78 family)
MLRRGFKSEAKARASEVRGELGIGECDQLNPHALAEHLAIPVLPLTGFLAQAPAVRHLLEVEPDAFSAVTVFEGVRRTIVHNDAHDPGRQHSNVCHELAHGLLLHPPTPALDDKGCRHWNQDIEDEASWLSGVLLVSEEATLAIARGRWNERDAASHFGVTPKMIRYRCNATGAFKRVERSRAAWSRRGRS